MNAQEKIETLKAARRLIEKPENWGSKSFALDKHGIAVPANDSAAVCFCSVGAIIRAAGAKGVSVMGVNFYSNEDFSPVEELAVGLPAGGCTLAQTIIYNWNDYGATHKEVLAHFDATIARLELQP